MDLFDIPLYYIGFKPNPATEQHFSQAGFRHIRHFPAIDARKFDPDGLVHAGVISARSYRDLKTGRRNHWGLPSAGAVGCTMSHCEVWKICISQNLPYIVICEEDGRLTHDLNDPKIQENIYKALSIPKGVFVGENVKTKSGLTHFMGLQFYIASRDACVEMVKHCFPIDVQTDFYLAHLDTIGKISVKGDQISDQVSHLSAIQQDCALCDLPNDYSLHFKVGAIFLCMICIILILAYKLNTRS